MFGPTVISIIVCVCPCVCARVCIIVCMSVYMCVGIECKLARKLVLSCKLTRNTINQQMVGVSYESGHPNWNVLNIRFSHNGPVRHTA